MARHGENIRKRKDGRWEGRYRAYSEAKGGYIYNSVYGKNYEEVRNKLDSQKIISKSSYALKGGVNIYEKVMFSDVAEKWLEIISDTKKPATYVKYRLIYCKYIKNNFINIELSGITAASIAENISENLSESTVKSIYCVFNGILKFASTYLHIDVINIKKPVFNARKKPIEVFTKKEQTTLFTALNCKTDKFKCAILLCLHTGLRLGEVCALKWEDIDKINKMLSINRTVQRLPVTGMSTKTALIETSPKSNYSKREIPLSSTVMKLIEQFEKQNNFGKVYIFGGDKPIEPRTMQYNFEKILKEAGLPDKNFHILRHTFATNCIEGGADVKSLSEILGHSDVQITLNRYVHPTMDTKRRHLDILSSFYGQFYGQAI